MSESTEDKRRTKLRRLAHWRPTGKQAAVGAGLIGLVALAVVTKGEVFEGAGAADLLSGWGGTKSRDDDDDRKPPRSPDPPDDPSLVYLE